MLDRSDEGLTVRAGVTSMSRNSGVISAYSAGSEWQEVGGVARPVYDIFEQETLDGVLFSSHGRLALRHDPAREHALGRPHYVVFRLFDFMFFTTRNLDMRYRFGAVRWSGCEWVRCEVEGLDDVTIGFDDEMTYFPGPVVVDDRLLVFYGGNGFGKAGLGVGEVTVA